MPSKMVRSRTNYSINMTKSIDSPQAKSGAQVNLLGEYIETYLANEGISMRELARRMGLEKGHSQISRTINGKSQPQLDFIRRLADVTGEDPGTLACLALGRPAQVLGDKEKMLQRVARLSDEHAVLWDIMLLAVKNLERPARLAAVVELLKE